MSNSPRKTQAKIRDNVAKLVEFTKKAETNTRATSRRCGPNRKKAFRRN